MGHRGEAIADTPQGPVFVPYALPGETVEVEREGDRARLLRVIVPSPQRIEPICPHFGTCGGCALQHWRTDAYRDWKRGLVVTALAQAGIEAPVADLIDAHGEGRRRATFHARHGGRKILSVGFAGRRSHEIVPIDLCPILAPPLARAISVAWRLVEPLKPSGKPIDLAFTSTDGGLDVDLRGTGAFNPKMTTTLAAIGAEEKLARITRHGELVAQFQEPSIKVGHARVKLPPGSFLQATALAEEILARLVTEAAGDARVAADLFCGVGTFALRLAERARVIAFDADAGAVAALARASAPGLKPIEARARDLFRRPLAAVEFAGCEAVVLDPPRQGAEEQARALAQSKAPRIVYVSCNPATFARDARILIDGGYRLVSLVPVDQFRYSAHVELVGVLDR